MPKKLVSFVKFKLIDMLVKDEASLKMCSDSMVLENHILKSFLPENEQACSFVTNYLYGEGENAGVGETLAAIWSYNAAGENWSSKHDNLLPLVEFAHEEESYCNIIPKGDEPEIPHFLLQIEAIHAKFKEMAMQEKNSLQKIHYENEAKYVQELLVEARKNPQFMRYTNFYLLVLDNWVDLKGWTITYRLLYDLSKLEKGWRTTPETRTKLLRLIIEISRNWKD